MRHPHIIKGRIIKVVRTESEEKFNYRGDHMGSDDQGDISNKMIFNVLTPKRLQGIDMKKGDKYAMVIVLPFFAGPYVHAGRFGGALTSASASAFGAAPARRLGRTCKNDRIANERAICNGNRIVSWYQLSGKTRVLIITEADRSATTIMLSEEY